MEPVNRTVLSFMGVGPLSFDSCSDMCQLCRGNDATRSYVYYCTFYLLKTFVKGFYGDKGEVGKILLCMNTHLPLQKE